MKRRDAAFIALFALLLAAVLFFVFTDRNTISHVENRALTGIPQFSFSSFISGDFQDQLEDALGDHMPFSEDIRSTVRTAEAGITRFEQNAMRRIFPDL